MSELRWLPPTQAQLDAADQSADVIITALRSDQGVHSETAIAGAARMAGTFLFRSFKFPNANIEPGSAVLSEAANEQGPLLIQTLSAGLNALEVNLSPAEMNHDIPEQNAPQLSIIETQRLLERSLRVIASQNKLSEVEAAHTCALVAAKLIQMCAEVLDPHVGFSLAAYGFIEGSKTAPIALDEKQGAKKPWYQVWK